MMADNGYGIGASEGAQSILPYIPESITVHLGPPDSDARNVTVPFTDYIKNVASSEIYPTWPENALRANIIAQTTFALNRIYTEYYPSRGMISTLRIPRRSTSRLYTAETSLRT